MPRALFEITGGILRLFAADSAQFGDPFEAAIFVLADEGVAILKGLRRVDHRALVRHRTDIATTLVAHGFTRVRWCRHRANGRAYCVEFPLVREKKGGPEAALSTGSSLE